MLKKENKFKCPICSGWFETMTPTKPKLQKHIGVGFFEYGRSKKSYCFGSLKTVTRTEEDIKDSFQKEQIFWNSEIKRINKLKEERI